MDQVVPVIIVVAFWAVVFCFCFWFFTRSLRAPTEGEHDAELESQHEAETSAVGGDEHPTPHAAH